MKKVISSLIKSAQGRDYYKSIIINALRAKDDKELEESLFELTGEKYIRDALMVFLKEGSGIRQALFRLYQSL